MQSVSRTSRLLVFASILLALASVVYCDSCCKITEITIDCNNCNYTAVPLHLTNNKTTDLLLASNKIAIIPDGSLANLTSLRRLVLSYNPLQNMNSKTFAGKIFAFTKNVKWSLQCLFTKHINNI